MKPFKSKYRIISDNYLGFEVQKKFWFLPYWFQVDNKGGVGLLSFNTFSSIGQAKQAIERMKNPVLYIEE